EKLGSNPCWRGPWQREQRCLLPAVGFYEWHLHPDGRKQPFLIQAADQELFCFAGLWDSSRRGDGTRILSCTLITMQGNELLRELHTPGAPPFRTPAILAREAIYRWLPGSPDDARQALRPYPAELMAAYPVSTRVNDPKNDDAALITPAAQDPQPPSSDSARDARAAEAEPENLSLF